MSAKDTKKQWGDFDDDEDDEGPQNKDNIFATKVDAQGMMTIVDYIDRDGRTYKVTKRVKRTINTNWTNRGIEARKELAKFGKAATNDAAAEKHVCVKSEEDIPVEFSKRLALQVNVKDEAEDNFYEESLTIAETMFQQKKAWTEMNKQKQDEQGTGAAPAESDKPAEAAKGPDGQVKTGYVPPSLRGKDGDVKGKGKGMSDEQCSLRVTNLAEDCKEGDLMDLFGSVGRVSRVYVPRDHETKQSKGSAFVTYGTRQDAEKAMKKLDGHPYDNLILRVQFAKPRV